MGIKNKDYEVIEMELLAAFLEGKRLDAEELKELEVFLIRKLDLVRNEKAL